jgi:hypothetical protein
MFVGYLLARNIRYEEDLVDQLFNSSEKRLARILLLLAHFGKEGKAETVIPKMSQEMGLPAVDQVRFARGTARKSPRLDGTFLVECRSVCDCHGTNALAVHELH